MEHKFTEGTWSFYTSPQPNGCPIVGNDKGEMVCVLAHSINHEEQRKTALANARLLATAPKLLEALKIAEEMLCKQENAMRSMGCYEPCPEVAILTARDAIAKATGEQE